MDDRSAGRPVPDTEAAVEFLERFRPGGPWHLTAIDPDRSKPLFGKTFDGSHIDALRAWVENLQGERNMYFQFNPLIGVPESGKASRADVSELQWLFIDIDPREREDFFKEQDRALHLFTDKLPEPLEGKKPTIIVFSGGGYQALWQLSDPVLLDGSEDLYEDAKLYNIELETYFGSDSCHDVSRTMRLPGTLNLPDESKRKKGRRLALARLVEFDENRVYMQAAFKKSEKISSASDVSLNSTRVKISAGTVSRFDEIDEIDDRASGPVPSRIKDMIVNGFDPKDIAGNKARNLPKKYKSPSEALFAVCCSLVKLKVSDDDIYSIITDAQFRISDCVLDKPQALERYAVRQIERAKDQVVDPWLRKLNDKYAVIRDIGGRCRVVYEVYDSTVKRHKISKQSFEDFRNAYCNKTIQQGVKVVRKLEIPNMVPLGKWWLENEHRREYDRIVFLPGGDESGCYNLWKGFSVQPRKADCSLFLKHVEDNLCSGNESYYEFVLDWMARLIQQPDRPGESAIVLQGRQGTGKTFFAEQLGHLFGPHFMAVSDPKHLVGSFNAHLRDCVLLLADEAYFAGDRKHSSNLKNLVTSSMVQYEPKGVDAEMGPNYTHIVIASNSEWVIPADRDERRFFVLQVGDEAMKDRAYFGAIVKQMKSGGYEGLLHYLMNRDISKFNPQAFPETEALKRQKLLSMSDTQEWWYSRLIDGKVLSNHHGWTEVVAKSALLHDYIEYVQALGVQRRATATSLGIFMKNVLPDEYPKVMQRVVKTKDGNVRMNCYELPGLDACRDYFDEYYGGGNDGYDWPTLDEREDPQDQMELNDSDGDVPF